MTEISTGDINAFSGSDYDIVQNEEIEFVAGETEMPAVVNIRNDDIVEDDEWFDLLLSNPSGGELGAIKCARVLIEDDDCEYQ